MERNARGTTSAAFSIVNVSPAKWLMTASLRTQS